MIFCTSLAEPAASCEDVSGESGLATRAQGISEPLCWQSVSGENGLGLFYLILPSAQWSCFLSGIPPATPSQNTHTHTHTHAHAHAHAHTHTHTTHPHICRHTHTDTHPSSTHTPPRSIPSVHYISLCFLCVLYPGSTLFPNSVRCGPSPFFPTDP